jgi:hypothetical protein
MSFAGRQMAKGIADKLPPPDKLSSYKGGGESDDGGDEEDGDMGPEAHASALLDAIQAKDPAAIVSAFKDLSSACSE